MNGIDIGSPSDLRSRVLIAVQVASITQAEIQSLADELEASHSLEDAEGMIDELYDRLAALQGRQQTAETRQQVSALTKELRRLQLEEAERWTEILGAKRFLRPQTTDALFDAARKAIDRERAKQIK